MRYLGSEEMAEADAALIRLEMEGRTAADHLGIQLARVERWRWDETVVSFLWIDSVGTWRGVNATLIALEDVVLIEGTAWIDRDAEQGRIRRWRADELWSGRTKQARRHFRSSFANVAGWSAESLERTEYEWEAGDFGRHRQ